MKIIPIAIGLMLSSISMASTIYKGSFNTKNLGNFDVELHLDFTPGMKADTVVEFYQDRIDQGQWGNWICHNSAKFTKSLEINMKVYNAKGLIGNATSGRYDQRNATLILNDIQSSPEIFHCDVFSLADKKTVQFIGHDSTLPVSGYSLDFKFDGSEATAEIFDRLHDRYELRSINMDQLISNQRNKIQWSLNKNHGSYSNNYEWGFVDLKKVK